MFPSQERINLETVSFEEAFRGQSWDNAPKPLSGHQCFLHQIYLLSPPKSPLCPGTDRGLMTALNRGWNVIPVIFGLVPTFGDGTGRVMPLIESVAESIFMFGDRFVRRTSKY